MEKESMENYVCEICGGTEFSLLFDRERNNENIKNYICENCGFVFVYPRPSDESYGIDLPNTKKNRDAERDNIIRYFEFKRLTSYAYIDVCKIKTNALNIDIGIDSFANLLNKDGWQVESINKISFEKFYSAVKYNLITAFNVIEHVLNPIDFLMKIKGLLSDEGIIYIDMPGLDKMHTNIDKFFWKPHINTFSLSSLREILERCGFKAIHIGYSQTGFLSTIAQKGIITKKVNKSHSANIYRLKSIVDSAYSPKNKNTENLFLQHESKQSTLRFVHLGVHKNGNAGDTLLFPAVRILLQKYFSPIEFTLLNLRAEVTQEIIDMINKHDGVIIGGGGLFLKDTNYNQLSGWQWACPQNLLEKIKVPIIVFAVGYNRFREQEDFDEVFKQSLNSLIEKSVFFSLRNKGSIEKVKKYVEPSLHDKLNFQPCPTTLLSKFYPYKKLLDKPEKILALNIPFDRKDLRYCYQESNIFSQIAEAIKEAESNGWEVVLLNNLGLDSESAIWLSKYGISLPQLNLNGIPPDKVISWYNKVTAVIGGRGHAQMIPFGLNIPIFSLISHDKMGYFLDDIKHLEWGEEVLSPLLKGKMINFVHSASDEMLHKHLAEAQEALWQVTMDNMEKLKRIFLK